MTTSFQRFAGWTAVLTAVASVVFTVAFAVVVEEGDRWAQWVSWITLFLGGLLAVPVLVALYARLGETEPQFGLVGFVLGVAGAIGAAVHGAFEWSVLANPGDGVPGDVPNAIDPRGVLTFGVTGLALGVFGWLIVRSGGRLGLPVAAGRWAVAAAVLLVVVYVARVTVLDPKTLAIRAAAPIAGLVLVPAFYVQIGRALLRDHRPATARGLVQAAAA